MRQHFRDQSGLLWWNPVDQCWLKPLKFIESLLFFLWTALLISLHPSTRKIPVAWWLEMPTSEILASDNEKRAHISWSSGGPCQGSFWNPSPPNICQHMARRHLSSAPHQVLPVKAWCLPSSFLSALTLLGDVWGWLLCCQWSHESGKAGCCHQYSCQGSSFLEGLVPLVPGTAEALHANAWVSYSFVYSVNSYNHW